MSDLVGACIAAWNARDGARLAALFTEGGTYQGRTTRMAIHPYDLAPVIEALAAQFSDFTFTATYVLASAEKEALSYADSTGRRGKVPLPRLGAIAARTT